MNTKPRKQTEKETQITIGDLYPHLGAEELREAEENFERYLELCLRMYERIQADPEEYRRFKLLTGSGPPSYDG